MVTIQIWTNRLLKEFDGIESRLPPGVSLSSHTMNAEAGVCRAVFDAVLTAPPSSSLSTSDKDEAPKDSAGDGQGRQQDEGERTETEADSESIGTGEDVGDDAIESSNNSGDQPSQQEESPESEGKIDGDPVQHALDNDGANEAASRGGTEGGKKGAHTGPLAYKIEMDLSLDTRYPFESPVIRVLAGMAVIPTHLLSGDVLVLPDSDSWTPSNTVVATLQDISDIVIHAREAGLPTGEADDLRALERGELRVGSLVPIEALGGYLFPCTPPPTPLFSGSMIMAPLTADRKQLDRYVGVTDRQVLELEAHRTRINKTVVISAIDLRTLSKLKFRRGSSVTLVLRGGESREFLTPQSHECVQTVTERLQKMGIAGHQTTAGAEKQVDRAKSIMASLQHKEKVLESEPSLDLVQESMDLFRQAAELFSAAEDPRHELVVGHMHAFLQRPEVLAVLEGKTAPPTPLLAADRGISGVGSGDKAAGEEGGEGSSNESVPRGEVLQRSSLPPLGSKGLGGVAEHEDDNDSLEREESNILEGGGSLDELQKMLEGEDAEPVTGAPTGSSHDASAAAGAGNDATEASPKAASKNNAAGPGGAASSRGTKTPTSAEKRSAATAAAARKQLSSSGGKESANNSKQQQPAAGAAVATGAADGTKAGGPTTSASRGGRGKGKSARGGAGRGARRGGAKSGSSGTS